MFEMKLPGDVFYHTVPKVLLISIILFLCQWELVGKVCWNRFRKWLVLACHPPAFRQPQDSSLASRALWCYKGMTVGLSCFESNHVLLRVEPRSASSRTTFCFESKYVLLRVEVRSASSRTTLREAYPACTSAVVQWHETHRAGLPEGRVDRRTGHLARPPSMPSAGCQAVGGSAPRRVRNIGCCRYGRPRSDRRCKRRLTQGAGWACLRSV